MSEPEAELQVRVAVIYYSATGNVRGMARAVAEGAEGEGAEIRLRHVAELSEELRISADQYWGRHRSDVDEEPVAQIGDLEWADGLAFGTPTRFGNVAAQLKVFLDLAGELWQEGKLIDKVATSFTSSQTEHGGQESTILAPRSRAGTASTDLTSRHGWSPERRGLGLPVSPRPSALRESPACFRQARRHSADRGRSSRRRSGSAPAEPP